MGVPSWGQRRHDTFTPLFLNLTITILIYVLPLVSGPHFLSPTHPLRYNHLYVITYGLTQTNLIEEDQWKGLIRPLYRPSPRRAVDVMSFVSAHHIDYQLG